MSDALFVCSFDLWLHIQFNCYDYVGTLPSSRGTFVKYYYMYSYVLPPNIRLKETTKAFIHASFNDTDFAERTQTSLSVNQQMYITSFT